MQDVLLNEDVINEIMNKFDKPRESREEYVRNRENRIKQLLAKAGYETEEDWDLYVSALSTVKNGYSIVMARDIDEIFINSYNPEWIAAWNGNIDVQICLDFFAIITYITEYFTKDDSGTMQKLARGVTESGLRQRRIAIIAQVSPFLKRE